MSKDRSDYRRAWYQKNKAKQQALCRVWRQNNYERKAQTNKEWQDKRRAECKELIALWREEPCNDCGLYNPYVMQFDHDPDKGEKLFNITDDRQWFNFGRFLAERAKCDVVCANCHFTRGKDRGQFVGQRCGKPSSSPAVPAQMSLL